MPTESRLRPTLRPASLLLPMGRYGPAFLAYANFQVYLKWNQSLNYCVTAAYLATRLAGAPPMSRGSRPIPDLSMEQVKELQQLLVRRGLEVGEIDGKLGAATRGSVKAAQMKLGLPGKLLPLGGAYRTLARAAIGGASATPTSAAGLPGSFPRSGK